MDKDVREQLASDVIYELERLGDFEPGTEEYKAASDTIAKLLDKQVEFERLDLDRETKEAEREDSKKNRAADDEFKAVQAKNEQRDRWIAQGVAIAGIVIPSLLTIWGTIKTLKFEETGTITTVMGRGFANKLLPKK